MSSLYVFLWACFRMALKQLARHKMRSFLTMLGILIGVGGVMTIVSLGEGLRGFFMDVMATQASADLVYIMPDVPMEPGQVARLERPFKNRDVDMVRSSEYVTSAIGGHIISDVTIKHGWRSERVMCQLVAHGYFPIDNWKLERGRYYTTAEERGRALVCVVGSEVKDAVYEEGERILDSRLAINGVQYRVIGELAGRSPLEGGSDANKMVFVPLETGQDRLTGTDDIYWMAVKVRSSSELSEAKEDIAARLRASRRIRSGKDDDFTITTPEDWAKFANGFVNTLITVFGVVAVIALFVGGIGVMNIMLVSVNERTREIGLRKALGATAGFITWQFLVEAMTLTAVGGLLGLLLGYALGAGVSLLMKSLWDIFWVPRIPLAWFFVVVGTTTAIGLIFGVYPAWRAGRLDPIVALRTE
ncbi:ABC transporter permease [bacterium]|nr:ABC transporter permease [bacterium]